VTPGWKLELYQTLRDIYNASTRKSAHPVSTPLFISMVRFTGFLHHVLK